MYNGRLYSHFFVLLFYYPHFPKIFNTTSKKKYYVTIGIGGNIGNTKKLFDKVANEVEADLKSSGELILNIGDLESRVKEVYGEPEAINQTETSNGIRRQYVFTSKKTGKQVYVYTKNNKVVAIQN